LEYNLAFPNMVLYTKENEWSFDAQHSSAITDEQFS